MTEHYRDERMTLLTGDSLEQARSLEPESVQTIITSPPYFGLRDYGHEGQLGSEFTVQEYVQNLVTLFHELHRTLRPDGTVWLNLGDSYASGSRSYYADTGKVKGAISHTRPPSAVPGKNLLGVPWRVAFALQDDGWILRSDIIWHKPNVMPESVKDRPTKAHEYLFLLAKGSRYYYDADAVREPFAEVSIARTRRARTGYEAPGQTPQKRRETAPNSLGRNRRTVWSVPTNPFPGAHFAVYPPELVRPCVRAGSQLGDLVLDPFSGASTTGMVALEEGRRYVGIDLKDEYHDLALRTRLKDWV